MPQQVATLSLPERRPATGRLLGEQMHEMVYRTPWDFLAMFAAILLVQVLLRSTGALTHASGPVFTRGAVTWPVGLVLVLVSVFWSIRVWSGLAPGDRDYYLSRPMESRWLILLRVADGLILFVCLFLVAWLLGAVIGDLIATEEMRVANRAMQGWGWLWTLLGLINAYLLGSIFAIRFRRPEHFVLIWVPVAIFLLFLIERLVNLAALSASINSVLESLFLGLGYAASWVDLSIGPHPGHLVLWLLFYAAIVVAVAWKPRRK